MTWAVVEDDVSNVQILDQTPDTGYGEVAMKHTQRGWLPHLHILVSVFGSNNNHSFYFFKVYIIRGI